MFTLSLLKLDLLFKQPAGTSRGVLNTKPSFFIQYNDENGFSCQGECSYIPYLSPDYHENIEQDIYEVIKEIERTQSLDCIDLVNKPALRFAIEQIKLQIQNNSSDIFYHSAYLQNRLGIPVNGLIWMGTQENMLSQVEQKVKEGYSTIKLKIGSLDFDIELALLSQIRAQYGKELTLRLDANGAFHPKEALQKLEALSKYTIHSIEQPIKPNQWEDMQKLIKENPIPIALDEEIISVYGLEHKKRLIDALTPQFLILKPSLLGGFMASEEWISLIKNTQTEWWVTSALESNHTLNALSQWIAIQNNTLPQGLGTGGLFTNNTAPYSYVQDGVMKYKR